MISMALVQSTICFMTALFLGLSWTPNIILVIIANIPTAFIFISITLICGTFFNEKQVRGLCGVLLSNLYVW